MIEQTLLSFLGLPNVQVVINAKSVLFATLGNSKYDKPVLVPTPTLKTPALTDKNISCKVEHQNKAGKTH